MRRFAFLLHPLSINDMLMEDSHYANKREAFVKKILEWTPAHIVSHITGLKCADGESAEGWFVMIFLQPDQFFSCPKSFVLQKIFDSVKIAKDKGASIFGLGGYSALFAADVMKEFPEMPMTSGNSCTLAVALEAAGLAAEKIGKDISDLNAVVIGAESSVGRICADIISKKTKSVTLIAKDSPKIEKTAAEIKEKTGKPVFVSDSFCEKTADADIIVNAKNSPDGILTPQCIKSGAILCDVLEPHGSCRKIAKARKDVLLVEGGTLSVPDGVMLNYNFGFEPGIALACMTEVMALCMENRFESYSVGNRFSLEKTEDIMKIVKKQGFKVTGLRNFGRAVTGQMIDEFKRAVKR